MPHAQVVNRISLTCCILMLFVGHAAPFGNPWLTNISYHSNDTDVSYAHASTTPGKLQTDRNVTQAPLKKISIQSLWPIYTHHTTTPPHDHKAGFEPRTPLSILGPSSIVKTLQQMSAIIPGFDDFVNTGFGLTASQLTTIESFAKLLMNATRPIPDNLTGILKSLQSSGLFGQVTSDPVANKKRLSRNVFDLCQEIVNATNGFHNDWLIHFFNKTRDMGIATAWDNVTIQGALDWCDDIKHGGMESNVTTKTPERSRHTSYQWETCQADVTMVLQGLANQELWAMQMVDASAKPGSSTLKGNLKFMGNYKECQDASQLTYYSTNSPRIQGNICRAFIKLPNNLLPLVRIGQTPRLQWDLCLPKSCLDYDLNIALRDRSLGQDIRVACTKDLHISDDRAAKTAIGVLSLFGFLLVIGTLLDVFTTHSRPNAHSVNMERASRGNKVGPMHTEHISRGNTARRVHPASIQESHELPLSTEQSEKAGTGEPKLPTTDENNKTNPTVVMEDKHPKTTANETSGSLDSKEKGQGPTYSPDPLPGWQRALLAFSIPRNTEKILSVKSAPGTIGCLHGIRVLSMAWVILGHVFMVRVKFDNSLEFFEMIKSLSYQIIIAAPLAVDTFFFLSGLLTCYVFMRTLGDGGKISGRQLVMYYVHRYWRLTPPLAIWIMVVACLLQYVGEGRPAWGDYPLAQNCRNNWWTNLLYINNVYKRDEPCVGVTWFLAHDMQFYVVAPLVMIPWVYGKKTMGLFVAIAFIGIHLVSTFCLELKYNADMFRNQMDYSHEIYFKPYTRVAPFAIGLIAGRFLWRTGNKVGMSKPVTALGWTVCFGLILLLTLVTYDENKDFDLHPWSKAGRVMFEMLRRPLWATAIAWVVCACATGHGGCINSILSWEGWLPLSRLTYSAFIVHLTIIRYESLSSESTILFTVTSLSYTFIGYLVMSYTVGYLLAVTVESPLLALEKVILG